MARIFGEIPTNRGEKKVFESLGRQLDDTWLMKLSVRYASEEHNTVIDREVDILLAHPDYGIFILEVKSGVLERISDVNWLHWKDNANRKTPTNAFDQIHQAQRSLRQYFLKHRAITKKTPWRSYVLLVDNRRPEGPLGPREEPLLIFGEELDDILEKFLKKDFQNKLKWFDISNIANALDPNVALKPYNPPAVAIDISGLESSISEIKEKISSIKEGPSREEIALEIDKIRIDIEKIPLDGLADTTPNRDEITRIHERLELFSTQLERIEISQTSALPASTDSFLGFDELKVDVLQIKEAIQAFNTRVGKEREVEIERVEIDLSSVEEQLSGLHVLVESLKAQPESAEQQHKLTSVLSSIGVLTARMTQLSQVVTANILPAEKFDAKLDRLAELYRDVTDRLEHMFEKQRPDMALVDELRREMRSMHDRLSEMSKRPLPAPILVSPNGSVVVKSRLSPGLVAASIVAVLAVGVATAAALKGNNSDVVAVSTTNAPVLIASTSAPQVSASSSSVVLATTVTSASTATTEVSVSEPTVDGNVITNGVTQSSSYSSKGAVIAPNPRATIPSITTAPFVNIAVSQVALGKEHTCVLNTTGSIYCWGSNEFGQLGQSLKSLSFSATALKVEGGGRRFTRIVSGDFHICALDISGFAYCWGNNVKGQVGNDSSSFVEPSPVQVSGGIRFSSISAGYISTCGLSFDGVAYCWGSNAGNELGSDVGDSSLVPHEVDGGWSFTNIVTGKNSISCGIEESGRILCWGATNGNKAFYGVTELDLYKSRYVGAVLGIGEGHLCVVAEGVNLRCFSQVQLDGLSFDELGVGSNTVGAARGQSKGTLPEPLVSLSLGSRETCGLTADGRAYCWSRSPTLVNTTQRFNSLDLFASDTAATRKCGVTKQNSLYCWGIDADGRSSSGMVTAVPTAVSVKARD